jgi:imidazolonepropionase
MPVVRNIRLLATCRGEGAQGDLHAVADAALAFRGDRITWVGRGHELPASLDDGDAWDAGGALVVPGLIDCHTHLAFGGWRADEFVRRIRGESYAQIAASGGGIAATVARTRGLDEEALLARARGFATEMAALGVTCVEAKSGYGLDRDTERRLLGVYRTLDASGPVRVVATYLGAHVVPRGEDRARYLALVEQMIGEVARDGLARFCDVFVDEGAFTIDEARRLLGAGRAAGLLPKLHADQLTDTGAAALAAEVGAVSADHLEQVGPAGIAALARAGVVAVSLPLAALYLDQAALPARALIDAGVPVAVASDFNPGSAPSGHLPLALTLACVRQRMTPAEALKGATLHAARALALEGERGSLEPGKSASFALIDAPDVDHWLYHFRANACLLTVVDGAARAGALHEPPAPAGHRP